MTARIEMETRRAQTITNRQVSRRAFLQRGCLYLTCFGIYPGLFDSWTKKAWAKKEKRALREAMFYRKLPENRVQCQVYFRGCILGEGERSFCRNKENINGRFYNLVYGRPSAVHIDPIEKEPSLHMLPGTNILCFGTAGCNFRCKFCHNWHLSQRSIEKMEYTYDISPGDAVKIAVEKKIPTISFTYNEPSSFYEYVYDIASLAKKSGVRILWHSNGGMKPAPLNTRTRGRVLIY